MTTPLIPPAYPKNSMEFVNAFAHYYRAEVQRAISWRDRLDRTTNWSIAAAAAILSVSLNQRETHHGALVFGMALVFLLLVIESRRYQYFDIYRRRVRLVECGYYAQIMTQEEPPSNTSWLEELRDSIREPRLTLTLQEAMAHRLRRNYYWIFLILLAAWLLKVINSIGLPAFWTRPSDLPVHADIGWTPGWVVLIVVLGFYGGLAYVMLRHGRATRDASLRGV